MPPARFKKGQLVRVVPPMGHLLKSADAITRCTAAEREQMYSLPYFRELGDDGESRLVPHYTYIDTPEGSLLTVIRARAASPLRYKSKGYVLALSTTMGRELWIHESMLVPLEEQVVQSFQPLRTK